MTTITPPSKETILTLIRILAEAEGLPVHIVLRQCKQESQFDINAENKRSGAFGLFQLMKRTAIGLGVDRRKWHENVFGGIKYLSQMYRKYNSDMALALAAYNWGPGNLDNHLAECRANGKNWRAALPVKETRDYLRIILQDEKPTSPSPSPIPPPLHV